MRTRRDFAAFTAGALAAKLMLPIAARANETGAPVGAPHPDAELIAACERHPALLAAYVAELGGAWGSGGGPAEAPHSDNCDRIRNTEAVTLAGVLAKARAAKCEGTAPDGTAYRQDFTSDASAWAWGVMEDLLRLTGAGA